jgi:DNA-binding FrmR family transcriptional regulator
MTVHASHPAIIKRLKRAHGHLASIIEMLVEDRPCVDVAQQLQAVEGAINSAKKTLIHQHIGDCLVHSEDAQQVVEEFKAIAKFL